MKWFHSPSALFRSFRSRPSLETLEDRTVPAVMAIESNGTLFLFGDNAANKIEIKDNGTNNAGNVRFRLDSNLSFEDDVSPWSVTQTAITTLVVHAAGGNDIVRYRLTGELAGQRVHDVQAYLGAGNDIFWGEVWGRLRNDASLRLLAHGHGDNDQLAAFGHNDLLDQATLGVSFNGGSGHDNIWGLMGNDVDVADDATLWMNMWGEDGNDQFGVEYAGDLHGRLLLHLEGGNHDDTVNVNFWLSNVSTGTVGDPDAPKTFQGDWNRYALVSGDAGNDHLTFRVFNPNPRDDATVMAKVLGGSGTDHYRRTNNVLRPEALTAGETDGP